MIAREFGVNVKAKLNRIRVIRSCARCCALAQVIPGAPAQAALCFSSGESLAQAMQNYSQQCAAPRRGCDPVAGLWYCSSESIGRNTVFSEPTSENSSAGNQAANNSGNNTPDTPVATTGNTTPVGTSAPSVSTDGVCIDSDGDGWGWNGSASCRVSAVAPIVNVVVPVNRPSTIEAGHCADPDGDGWGWTGTESCRVGSLSNSSTAEVPSVSVTEPAGKTYRTVDITDLVMVTGQSNALGANTSFNSVLDAPHERVFAFTNKGWKKADLHQIWDRGWHPRNNPDTDPSNNFAFHFGKQITRLAGDRVVGFILVTAPGAAIANWEYNGDFYRLIRSKVLDAINQLPHKSSLDGILWHQGETDALDTPVDSAALTALIRNFRTENWFDRSKPVICGEIAMSSGVNKRLNGLNRDVDASTACVRATDLPTKSDGAHFTAEALHTLGSRYGNKFLEMTR